MKITLFAAALIGLVSKTQAYKLIQDENYAYLDYELAQIFEEYPEYNYDLAQIDGEEEDWQLAQIDSNSEAEAEFAQSDIESAYEFAETESEAEASSDIESEDLAEIDVDSETKGESQLKADACQQIVNGVTIRLTTPECTGAAAAN